MEDRPLPWGVTPEILNDLYRIYRKASIGDGSRELAEAISKHRLDRHKQWIIDSMAIVLGAPYSFLDQYPGGAVSSDALWAEHDAYILEASPWLDEDNLGSAQYQSRYYAWHDGLVKSTYD